MYHITPTSSFDCTIDVPCSKSAAQRALALALCTNGKSTLIGLSKCDDIDTAINIINKCGAKTTWKHNTLEIISKGIFLEKNNIIDSQESGLSCRMFSSLIACQVNSFKVHGKGSLIKREMAFFEKQLSALNVSVKTNNHRLPFKINIKL